MKSHRVNECGAAFNQHHEYGAAFNLHSYILTEQWQSSALHIQLTITSDLQGLTDILGPSPSISPSAAILQLQKPTSNGEPRGSLKVITVNVQEPTGIKKASNIPVALLLDLWLKTAGTPKLGNI